MIGLRFEVKEGAVSVVRTRQFVSLQLFLPERVLYDMNEDQSNLLIRSVVLDLWGS